MDAPERTQFSDASEKQGDIRTSNILAAKGIFDLIRTSLGPRGLDKMVTTPKGDVLITNDGATIMKQLEARHPAARMLIELSQSQDVEAGDGTTTVVVLAGSMLSNCLPLFKLGIHPTTVSEGYQLACGEAQRILRELARPVDLAQTKQLEDICKTTLSSKVVANHSEHLAPLVVRAVLQVREASNVDLRNIHLVKKVGGTLADCAIVDGVAFSRKPREGPGFISGVKVGLARFHLSAPKTDMESNVVVSDDAAINRLLEQERKITLRLCKAVAKTGCNLLLVQKSILREAISDIALHYLKKLKITVIDELEREEMEFVSAATGAVPVATIEEFTADKLGAMAELRVEDGITYVTNVAKGAAGEEAKEGKGAKDASATSAAPAAPASQRKTCTIVVRGANKLILDEAERSIHDALCAVRCLVKLPLLIPGGGAVETEVARRLYEFAATQEGATQYCVRAYADAFEVIPLTLSENAGLAPIQSVTELRRAHADGNLFAGINVKASGEIQDMYTLDVVSPALVLSSAINLATETTRMLLKIDDIVLGR